MDYRAPEVCPVCGKKEAWVKAGEVFRFGHLNGVTYYCAGCGFRNDYRWDVDDFKANPLSKEPFVRDQLPPGEGQEEGGCYKGCGCIIFTAFALTAWIWLL